MDEHDITLEVVTIDPEGKADHYPLFAQLFEWALLPERHDEAKQLLAAAESYVAECRRMLENRITNTNTNKEG